MKAKAPEDIDIKIKRVAVFRVTEIDRLVTSVDADATVFEVHKSKSHLKVGDTIRLSYKIFKMLRPGWVGPSLVPRVEKGKPYRAFLQKNGAVYSPAAGGQSFISLLTG